MEIKSVLCGGTLRAVNGMFVCINCGTEYPVEEARKLINKSENNNSKNEINNKVDKKIDDCNFYYKTDVGMFMKNTFEISEKGILWKNKIYQLNSITRIRFGKLNRKLYIGSYSGPSIDRISSAVWFGTDEKLVKIEFSEKQYDKAVDSLWKAVAPKIIKDVLEKLKSGVAIPIGYNGSPSLTDDGIVKTEYHFLAKNTYSSPYIWENLGVIWTYTIDSEWGWLVLYLDIKELGKWNGGLVAGYFRNNDNVNIYVAILALAKKYKPKKLSDLL